MARRNFRTAAKGQVYASEWPEWHVDCACEDCESHALVAGCGEAMTAREAEKIAAKIDGKCELSGWKRIGGLWFCQNHGQ